jgi:hypothetical protein
MSTPKLYHREVFLPNAPAIRRIAGMTCWHLHYSGHSLREAIHDRNGIIYHPPIQLTFTESNVIEVELNHDHSRVNKMVVRIPYCDLRDLVLVLDTFEPGVRECRVRTLWTNLKTDRHATLDRSKYATN